MQRSFLAGQRLIALFALGWLLFNYPLLSLFHDTGSGFGMLLPCAYLFVAWALFICLLAMAVRREPPSPRRSAGKPEAAPPTRE